MPNHLHVIIYFPQPDFDLAKIIANAKRFMAYDIIKAMKVQNCTHVLNELAADLTQREKDKGQLHKVFEESFNAKPIYSTTFLYQKADYIHHNPVSGKWQLAADFTDFEYSSASFYEKGISKFFQPFDFRNI